MTPFLKQVAEHYHAEGRTGDMCFIFPNRRSLSFFKKYLGEEVSRDAAPMLSPKCFTMNDFFYRVAGRQATGRISLLVELYNCYKELVPRPEPLDEFIFWGDVLLGDFDDVDKYLVREDLIFTNVAQFKQYRMLPEELSETQRAALEQFLGNFHTDGEYKNRYLGIWSILLPLYRSFNERLRGRGQSYEGQVYREIAEKLETVPVPDILPDSLKDTTKFVFVGLNALNECERRLLSRLRDARMAEFCWDYSSQYIKNPLNRSSFFLERFVQEFPQAFKPDPDGLPKQNFNLLSVPSSTGQAKQLPRILENLGVADIRTALVLPDENLLLPVLNSIPPHIDKLNVTMGYPMAGSALWSLMNDIASLQMNVRIKDSEELFYHKQVFAIASNSIFKTLLSERGKTILDAVKASGRYYVSRSSLSGDPLLETLFRPAGEDIASYLQNVVTTLAVPLRDKPGMALELDFAKVYYEAVGTLRNCEGFDVGPSAWYRTLSQMVRSAAVPFKGEPLQGLQIMGPLETRALDFDNLVILSCNEGMFPRQSVSSSFIPPELRKGFGLPTYEHQDAVWAYYFYRMIQRASNVWLVYDSRTEVSRSGEPSRYISQLEMHFGCRMKRFMPCSPLAAPPQPSVLAKTAQMIEELKKVNLSVSVLKRYEKCPAQFYFYKVCGLRVEDEVSEFLDAADLGNVYHAALEHYYGSFGGTVTQDALEALLSRPAEVKATVRRLILDTLKTFEIAGRNIITEDLICRYVLKTFERDLELMRLKGTDRFSVLGLELPLSCTIDGFRFFGKLDRVDSFEPGTVRIVDYKTGSVDKDEVDLQLYLYSVMLSKNGLYPDSRVLTSIYNSFKLFVEPVSEIQFDQTELDLQQSRVSAILSEISDTDIPFERKGKDKICEYCDFKQICGK